MDRGEVVGCHISCPAARRLWQRCRARPPTQASRVRSAAAPRRGAVRAQDVARITHRDDVAAMVRKGRDLERLVLARAVRWVLQDRVLVHSNKTVVFEE
jgi:hypothetical protein